LEYLVIAIVALFASCLTFFSGFGLGTILLPAFALFFPVEAAVALTAIVHFLNNLLKLILLGKHARPSVVLKFGLPSLIAAAFGAWVLINLQDIPTIHEYFFGDKLHEITIIKLVIAFLMILFAVLELSPRFSKLSFSPKWLPLGGLLSGFFGGISGHQGALRSAFLTRLKLSKEQFIATGVVIACMVDTSRIFIYSSSIFKTSVENWKLMIAAILFAFIGTYIGSKFLKKITFESIQKIVGILLIVIGLCLGIGLV